ncbi:MAG: CUAEP/CCAEP-tail radical SAM protein, partial [Proteobacteria bacterium]|nr:CUAEP/CCAEP-tail radical SAM protein [Pseudomonadota bacterium]
MAGPFKVVLINPYELGRQPFALGEPAAWLKREGIAVTCLDLSLQKLDPEILEHAGLVAIYVGMHTATRIAIEAIPRIRDIAPQAHLCVYGLYAPMNQKLLRGLGVKTILGGEFEPGLMSLAQRLRSGDAGVVQTEPVINLAKIEFI